MACSAIPALRLLAVTVGMATTVLLGSPQVEAVASAVPSNHSDSFYSWTFDDGDNHLLNLTGFKPIRRIRNRAFEFKMPFTFPFYGRPQTTIYIHPDAYIFPHRISNFSCKTLRDRKPPGRQTRFPINQCDELKRKTSYIAPLFPIRGVDVTVEVYEDYRQEIREGEYVTRSNKTAVHFIWSMWHGTCARPPKATKDCEFVKFTVSLSRNGNIDFEFTEMPVWKPATSPQKKYLIGMKDSVVRGGYGKLGLVKVKPQLLSSINVNVNDSTYNARHTPVHIHFVPVRQLVKVAPPTNHTTDAHFAGRPHHADCHNATDARTCSLMPSGLDCDWCEPASGRKFKPFCGRHDDSDPNADLLFSGSCKLHHFHNKKDNTEAPPRQVPQVHEGHTATVLGGKFYSVTDSHDEIPQTGTKNLTSSYYESDNITLPFKFPFFKHPITRLAISSRGFLYVPGDDCSNCNDPIHRDRLLGSHISPLAGLWDFNSEYTPRGEASGMRRFDANDGSYVHFEWANAKLTEYKFDCPSLHCRQCACPVDDLPPVTFSATLHTTGKIVFRYDKLKTIHSDIPFDSYYGGHIGIKDALVSHRRSDMNKSHTFNYGEHVEWEALDHHSETVYHGIIFDPVSHSSCNSALGNATACSAKVGGQPCLWCTAADHYTLRQERTFCSDSQYGKGTEVHTKALQCRFFDGQKPAESKKGTSTGTVVGSVIGSLLAVTVGVTVAVLASRGKLRERASSIINFKQFTEESV